MNTQTAAVALALAALWQAAPSTARAAVATGATTLSCAEVQLSASGVGWADVHYVVNGGARARPRPGT